jgi:hypothetical protein
MKYKNGGAFRQALEDRLRGQSVQEGTPLVRLRKAVAFERFLARLMLAQPGTWLLKGGLALQWRLGNVARTTQDVDLLVTRPGQDMHLALVQAALLDLGDWFRFLVQQPASEDTAPAGARFLVQALLDGRPFERFHVDIGWGDPVLEPGELLAPPPLLGFADIQAAPIVCYPLSQHLAEKVHAYTLPRRAGDNSRVKDLVDMLLIAKTASFRGLTLRQALLATFAARGTHALPECLPDPPSAWAVPFREMSRNMEIKEHALAAAMTAVRSFLDPLLQDHPQAEWDPLAWTWR